MKLLSCHNRHTMCQITIFTTVYVRIKLVLVMCIQSLKSKSITVLG